MAFKSITKANLGLVGSPSTLSATVSAGQTHTVIGLQIANTQASNITVQAKFVKSGGDTCFLVKDSTIAPGGALVLVGADQKLVLETGDYITGYCQASTSADSVLSYLV